MIPGNSRAREHLSADIVVILSVVYLALATWSCLSGSSGIPLWKCYSAVLTTMFLALATLTRRPYWAALFRLLTAGWIVAAPYLLAFTEFGPLPRTYLMIGGLIAAVSLPTISLVRIRRGNAMSVLFRNAQAMRPATSSDL